MFNPDHTAIALLRRYNFLASRKRVAQCIHRAKSEKAIARLMCVYSALPDHE